jgi:proteic killer suppression protein
MIRSFADKRTAALMEGRSVRSVAAPVARACRKKLQRLDAVEQVEELRMPPGNRLEKLAGDRAGQWSIRVNDQWRICFRWQDGDAFEVELVDYH